MTIESQNLRKMIRDGTIDCPVPYKCNRLMAEHTAVCSWQMAIERIYELEREEEQHG